MFGTKFKMPPLDQSRSLLFRHLVAVILFSSTSVTSASIERKIQTQDEISATIGTFLPWGFPGVTEQMRFFGASYFHPTSIWDIEYEFLNGRGSGVNYFTVSAGPRFDFRMSNALDVFLNGGLAYHYYKRSAFRGEEFPFRNTFGIFFGFGGLVDLTPNLKLRAEMKFHNSPGKSVYVGIGPSFVF